MTSTDRADSRSAESPRAAWGSLSRDQVVATARAILATNGLQALTIRALARELGVAPMSIYRHVASRADLLDQVVDQMLDERWEPASTPKRHWREWVLQAAQNLQQLLVDEPAARMVYLSHPVVSPAAVRRMRAMLDVLHRGLGDDEMAEQACAVVQSYTIGFAVLQASRANWHPGVRDGEDVELARRVAEFAAPEHFGRGLRYLLDGIAAR